MDATSGLLKGPVDAGLTSDVLRVRAVEYYSSCLPEGSRIYKSGSMTHLNGCCSSPLTKFGTSELRHGVRAPRHFAERPHRTHSERSNNRVVVERTGNGVVNGGSATKASLYRSNSSLDLDHGEDLDHPASARRDYGSASSLDLLGSPGDSSFFAMLREFRRIEEDQRSPGPAKIHELLRGRVDPTPALQNASNALANGALEEVQSPKLKTKFHKLLEIKDRGKGWSRGNDSIFKKLRGGRSDSGDNKCADNGGLDPVEEKLRKKAFAHYDCQSITADLSEASIRLASLLSKRRNTTTGASAASMLSRTPECCGPEDIDVECALDNGDGRETLQLLSCPFFRNEIGGEEERAVSLNRVTCQRPQKQGKGGTKGGKLGGTVTSGVVLHRPVSACGLSVLESSTKGARWRLKSCPYQRPSTLIEGVDHGASYYRTYFHGKEHQNWFGIDEHLGPVAVSIRREKMDDAEGSSNSTSSSTNSLNQQSQYQYRLVVRTSELAVLRGTILEEAIPNLPSARSSSSRGSLPVREVLEYVAPEFQTSCLRLGIQGTQTEEQLMKLDEQGLMKTYKVGVMYCKAGQATEEEMYNNEMSGPAFEEFLEMLGHKVRLKGFENYRAGLDNKTDTTGLYSVYSRFEDCEVMFHVSTLLPYTPSNKQQLLRKRHIGNDIVTIVFQEPDAQPFTPKNIRSHFQHVFIVVRAIDPCTENTRYSVAVSRSKEVPAFGPPIPDGPPFPKSKKFTEFILAKVINAENAAHRSEKFATMAQRTRQEYLKDLANNYSTNTTLESGPKFSILNFGIKKKERNRPRFIPDAFVQGAIAWQVQVEDHGQSSVCDCILGISAESLVLLEESTRELVFGCPTSSVVGWSSHSGSLKLFYHQGECIVLKTKDPEVDEIQEIVSRLSCVTSACETQELILRRNSLGQLGFHVQFEGIVTEVENYGFAWKSGLRKGCRLVEICKVAVATLNYDQMVDLLKTSMTVSVTVVPPHKDGSPRRGCNLHNCSYLAAGMGDYENVGNFDSTEGTSVRSHAAAGQQVPSYSQFSARSESQAKCQNLQGRPYDSRTDQNRRTPSNRSHQSPPPVPARASRTPPGGGSSSGYRTPESPSSLPPLGVHLGNGLPDNTPLMHVGSLVASRSELSLAQLSSSSHHHHHHHHLGSMPFGYSGRVLQAVENFSAQIKSQSELNGRSPSLPRDLVKGLEKSTHLLSSDYQSDSSSDWQLGTSSADELSCGSHRSTPPRSCSYRSDLGSSQNNSPRASARRATTACEPSNRPGRLRVAVCSSASSRPPSSIKAGSSSTGSGGSTGSTLQEDLLKLISPEYLDSDSEEPTSVPSESGSCHTCLSTPYSSLERTSRTLRDPSDNGDVILTKAQPAQVVASEPSSPAPPERRMTRDERLSPRVTSDKVLSKLKPPARAPQPMVPVPEGRNLDWPTLVDTATKAMQVARSLASKGSWSDATPLPPPPPKETMSNGQPVKQLHDLEERVVKLQETLALEQHEKATLEQQVRHLQEENHRLHEESQSATAQLKKLTDWFFHTMDSSSSS
ncbi:signal-induced proliferation-associated 1-like protein 2 [Ornithodoros turicata]|uniref:signal-induced proliferation-associated 1-like protein 2 n=1 Tax=Ornithodoros turicata TaxID=34597 RepID=UPI003138FD18